MSKVLYPGSFDPITKGHMNIIEQASVLFDEVVVAVLCNPHKRNSMFSVEERVDMIQQLYSSVDNIMVSKKLKHIILFRTKFVLNCIIYVKNIGVMIV